jgi:dephospho-CoA kinase
MPYAVGLTGGIGSGKSTVADLFAARGAGIVDTDVISHALTAAGGGAIPAIRQRFGAASIGPDGALDRAWMRALVFRDPQARRDLEGILHPLIRAETRRQAESQPTPYVIIVIPLLVESGSPRHHQLDRIAVVDCDPELQVERVMQRSGLTREMVLAIMASQASREQRLAAADDVIHNDGGLERLEAQVAPLHELYRRLALGA